MSIQSWQETIFASLADSTAVTGTAEAIVVPDITLPANYMYPGRVLYARIAGKISNVVTTPGTITLRARWGGVAGTVLAVSDAISQNIIVQTDDSWEAEFWITCRTAGASGSFLTSGKAFFGNAIAASAGQVILIPSASNAVVGSLTTVAATALSFTAKFSVNLNSITALQYTLASLS